MLVVRRLNPFHENISKRQVKSPKVYLADSGLLHTLLNLESRAEIESHPKLGASWEGFCLEAVVRHIDARWDECFFWATHTGAELDLLVVRGMRRRGFEFKRTDAPGVSPSMRSAMKDLRLDDLTVIHAGTRSFPLGKTIRAIPASRILEELEPQD
jgi:predicted AAA+ superfamily ATPase